MNIPTEAQEQTALFQWAAYMKNYYPELELMHHVANGGSRNIVEAHNLRLQGVKPGIPDICLPCARKGRHGLYIELKRQKNGRVSIEQKKMLVTLREQGYEAVVCYGWEDAKKVILEYLEG